MQNLKRGFRSVINFSLTPSLLSLLGGVAYFFHALYTARTTTSFLDEGMYLYKGWLFVTGAQVPFAEYNVRTNHSILSFLIPGVVQQIGGPGLDSGRYFMIIIGLCTLAGLWVFAKRWGNAWWAVGVVWTMALNPAEIKLFTLVITQGMAASLLTWILVLTIGERRRLWEVMLGAALSSLIVLTRETMVFVPPILFLYIFWQHGWKTGLLAMFCSGLVFAAGNAFYFPENLYFWVQRAPAELTPFLDPWRMNGFNAGETLAYAEEANLFRQVLYFFLIFRLHFVALFSSLAVWLLWPYRNSIRTVNERVRAAVFLSVLFLILFVIHIQWAFFGELCISCALLYVGYFDFIGLMLLVLAAPLLQGAVSRARQAIICIVLSVLVVGVGFSAYEDVSSQFARSMIDQLDPFYIWNALLYVTGLPHLMLFRILFVVAASLFVLAAGGVILWVRYGRSGPGQAAGGKTGVAAVHGLLILGLILSPTKMLGNGNDFFDCSGEDVFESYERAGRQLSTVIESGAKVYWEGRIPAIFLYLPPVDVFPMQLNHVHTYKVGGDTEQLYRAWLWNNVLAEQWLLEADYILVQKTELVYLTEERLESKEFVLLMASPSAEKCRWQSVIHVYQRAGQ